MTTLSTEVRRQTVGEHSRWHKKMVVTLKPGDTVGVRLSRSSREFTLPVQYIYDLAESLAAKAGSNV